MGISQVAAITLLAAFPAVLFAAQPASHAATSIPEPTDVLLFSMAVIGLIVGRRAAMKPKDRENED